MGALRTTTVKTVHVVVPGGIDDPARPSGGNVYDRRICRGLAALGWNVTEHAVDGGWPWPDAEAHRALDRVIAQLPDGAVVLIDGLIASTVPAVLVPHARRLALVVIVHLPLGDRPPGHEVAEARNREGAVLGAATASSRRAVGARPAARPRTRCGPSAWRWPSPAPTPPNSRQARPTAANCSASQRSRRTRDTTSCSRHSPPSANCRGVASWSEPSIGILTLPIS